MKPGAEQLTDWINRRWPLSVRKNREAAEHFNWDETFISMLCRGVRAPGLANAIKIERESGIPVEAWVPSELDKPESEADESADKPQLDRA